MDNCEDKARVKLLETADTLYEAAGLSKRQIGRVSVDTGTIVILDPGYIQHKDFDNEEFVESILCGEDGCGEVKTVGYAKAVHTSHFGGDGNFPVYALQDQNGLVIRLSLEFNQ